MSLDGIKKIKSSSPVHEKISRTPTMLKMDGIIAVRREKRVGRRPLKPKYAVLNTGKFNRQVSRRKFLQSFYVPKNVPVVAVIILLFIAFSGGIWAALNTTQTAAETKPQVLAAETSVPAGSIIMPDVAAPAGSNDSNASNSLFNTPIEFLKNYIASTTEPDIIEQRKNQIEQFLTERHSPLAAASETIAQQPHWQLILAIAFAESTLGKNCADYNCSNIGVGPGSPYWRKYSSYSAWVLDFNRLLDKKYNNWTLQQMCGVYVKPCNPNWLLATSQILTALNQEKIQ